MKKRIKRNYYRNPKYFYTALRFMVEIYKKERPKELGEFTIIKTVRMYQIDTVYYLRQDGIFKKMIPLKIRMPILSKNREDLRISMPTEYSYYRNFIIDKLRNYYLHN